MQDQLSLFLRGSVFFSVAFGMFQVLKYMKEQRQTKTEEGESSAERFDIMKEKIFLDAIHRYKDLMKLQSTSPSTSVSEAPIFQHQVAGHTREVLRKMNDKVLKPMIKPKLFLNEVRLYEDMASSGTHCTQFPHAFVPKYFGCVMGSSNHSSPSPLPYLVLEDVTRALQLPCVMDVKMGRQTFEPNASPEKKEREVLKYPYQAELGFRITGFKVFDRSAGTYAQIGKGFGRSLLPQHVKHGLGLFFYDGVSYRVDAIQAVVARLEQLLRWMRSQTRYNYYCSSILLVYEAGCPVVQPGATHFISKLSGIAQDTSAALPSPAAPPTTGPRVDVRMIDFAHTLRTATDKPLSSADLLDEGYIHGLKTLILLLEDLLVDIKTGCNAPPAELEKSLQLGL